MISESLLGQCKDVIEGPSTNVSLFQLPVSFLRRNPGMSTLNSILSLIS